MWGSHQASDVRCGLASQPSNSNRSFYGSVCTGAIQPQTQYCGCFHASFSQSAADRLSAVDDLAAQVKPEEVELVRRDYCANGGWETFLAYEDVRQDILVGLLRLRRCFGPVRPFSSYPMHNCATMRALAQSLQNGNRCAVFRMRHPVRIPRCIAGAVGPLFHLELIIMSASHLGSRVDERMSTCGD